MRTPVISALLALAMPLAAQQEGTPLDFDLVEINAAPGPSHPGVDFVFTPVGEHYAQSGGVAVADFNNDDYLDMFFTANEGAANHFYVNNGDGTFSEEAFARGLDETAKRRGCALFFDLDNDGDLDLMTTGYPGRFTINLDLFSMYRNDGAPGYGYTDITNSCGGFVLDPTLQTTTIGVPGGMTAADYDNDGFVDVFITYWDRHPGSAAEAARDMPRLWRNVQNPVPDQGEADYTPRLLEDGTLEANIDDMGGDDSFWQPNFVDVDRDGLMDLHVNIEYGEDELRLNNGDGSFGPNIATAIGMNFNESGAWAHEMGSALADYDNDLDIDFYLTNPGQFVPGKEDAFYRNDSDLSEGGSGLRFKYVGDVSETEIISGVGWGACWADMDNDGDKDLLSGRGLGGVGLGVDHNWLHRNLFPQLASDGESIALEDVSAQVPDFYRADPADHDMARSVAAFDMDNDGDLDVVYTRTEEQVPTPGANLKAAVFENTLSNGNNWIQVKLVETAGSLNTTGAEVYLRTGGPSGVVQMRQVRTGSSFLSQEGFRLHFGLGTANTAEWVVVRWADGSLQVERPTPTPLAGMVTVARDGIDDTGDLNGDAVVDCTDLELFVLSRTDPSAVDTITNRQPWRITADADGNGIVEVADYTLLRAKVAAASCQLGGGVAGVSGVPVLAFSGVPASGNPVTLALTNGLPNRSAYLVFGFSPLFVPFKGGTMTPALDILMAGITTDGNGDIIIPFPWPASAPPGVELLLQYWIPDGAASFGFSGSNGLSVVSQ